MNSGGRAYRVNSIIDGDKSTTFHYYVHPQLIIACSVRHAVQHIAYWGH